MRRAITGCVLLLFLAAGCGKEEPAGPVLPEGPYVLVLGTAQDAGLPQIGADHPLDRAARKDPRKRRFVASLLICDPRTGKRWLIDATPDLREQVELARGHPPTRKIEGPRPPLFEGIFLTHAHMGHYTGLIHLGREAYNAKAVSVHGSRPMVELLSSDAPWRLLVAQRNIVTFELRAGESVKLGEDLTITPVPVPHRAELTDTFAFVIRGPRKAVLYLPDIDKWELWDRWEQRIEDHVAAVDHALLDGTFFADGEIPGRPMADIPHPFIAESMARFARLPEKERAKIWFTHLNHTNPASDPGGEAQRKVREAGFGIASDGQILDL